MIRLLIVYHKDRDWNDLSKGKPKQVGWDLAWSNSYLEIEMKI